MKNVKGTAFVLFSVLLVLSLGAAMAENNQTMKNMTNVTMMKNTTNATMMENTTNATMMKNMA